MLPPLRQIYLQVQDAAIAFYARAFRKGPFIRKRFSGEDPLQDALKAAAYVHYDRCGVVHDYVVHQLRELNAAGFRVTFITNSPELPKASLERVQPLCKEILWRFNVGYDLGAYKDSLSAIDLRHVQCLLLMNDSVYGPFRPLSPIINAIDPLACDFWGFTESLETGRHLQGYFLLFFPRAFLSKSFARFWREVPYVNHKFWIVRNGEIELTRTLEKAGLKGGSFVSYGSLIALIQTRIAQGPIAGHLDGSQVKAMSGVPLNPMQYFWDFLIEDFNVPFIKRDLIEKNPANVANVARWRTLLRKSGYGTATIDSHLASTQSVKR